MRDLARTCPASNFDRQFHENLFRQANILQRIFNYIFWGLITILFPNQPSSKAWPKCELPFLTQYAINYMNLLQYTDLKYQSS